MTARNTWKQSERRNAAFFGARRNVLSGSAGRNDLSESDSTHPTLFLESKLKAKCAVRTLWSATKAKARKERKTPVLMLCQKHSPGALIVVHEDDFDAVYQAWKARGEDNAEGGTKCHGTPD